MVDKRYGAKHGRQRLYASERRPATAVCAMTSLLFDVMDGQMELQSTVADKIGRHPVSLSYWRHGVHEMKAGDLEAMAAALGYRWQLVATGAKVEGRKAQ